MDLSNSHLYSDLLIKHILGGNAFIKLEEILEDIDYEQVGLIMGELPYSFWQIFEHMRIAQNDILEYSESSDFRTLKWPDEYWPDNPAPHSPEEWETTKREYFRDRERFNELLTQRSTSLLTPFDWGEGQNLFREAILIIEHNAYHIGQLMIISRLIHGKY